jgi:hypothetical protein
MSEETVPHVIAGLLLIGRLGDIVSTWLITPTLLLETNPVARRQRWRLAIASLLLPLVPYISVRLGMILLVPSLLTSSSNLRGAWIAHALGERDVHEFYLRAAAAGRRRASLAFVVSGAGFMLLSGCVLMWLSTYDTLPYWFGFGIVVNGIAEGASGWAHVVRMHRSARTSRDVP